MVMNKKKSKKFKTYSFDLVVPKDFKNDWIIVKANNPKTAKKLLIKETQKLNERFMVVKEFDVSKNDLKEK